MTTIGIISDNSDFLNKFEKNLSLMRKNDIFLRYDCTKVSDIRKDVEIVLLYSEHTNITEDFISKIKRENNYLILFLPKSKEDLLLKLYDYGINDFCRPDASVSEVIVKIINGQKYISSQKNNEIFKNILCANDIIKENNSVYKKFESVLVPKLSKICLKSSFFAIDIPEDEREKFISEKLEARMISALRQNDIIINYKDFSYFVILTDTEFDKVRSVFDKLSNSLGIKLTGMLLRYKSLKEDEILEKIDSLRVIAQKDGKNFIIEPENTQSETEKDWLENGSETDESHNYKFFRAIYNSKVDKIIKPLFFRMQEKYEDLLSDIKIKFYNEKNYSEFVIFKGEKTNSLKILFTNSPSLTFQLNYSGIYTPENVEFTLPFVKLTIKSLTEIIEKFIKEGLMDASVK